MLSPVTPRLLMLYVFLFAFFFPDVNARSLALKNDKPQQPKDKEISFPLEINSQTTSLVGKHDSTFFGVPTASSQTRTKTIIDIFRRPLYVRENDLGSSNGKWKCKQNPTRLRRRRYVLEGSKLRNYDVTWTITVFSKKMSQSDQIAVLTNAFKVWSSHSTLKFSYVTDPSKAVIAIKFVRGDHGDKENFDDAGPLRAHAFFPQAGSDIHFDEYEPWTKDPNKYASLLSTAIHEIGHSIGLRHSPHYQAVMYPTISDGKNTLDSDDIKGVQAMYGKCHTENIDAVMAPKHTWPRTFVYVFKNDLVWEVDLQSKQVNPGYPQQIGHRFNHKLYGKHPFKAVFEEYDYDTITFMNNKEYLAFDDVRGYPFAIGNHYIYPSRVFRFLMHVGAPDTAFVDPHNDHLYHFFKGSQYYKYDNWYSRLYPGYPKPIDTDFPGVPSYLDAAYYNFDEKRFYFIKGKEYFIYSTQSKRYYPAGILTDLFRNIC